MFSSPRTRRHPSGHSTLTIVMFWFSLRRQRKSAKMQRSILSTLSTKSLSGFVNRGQKVWLCMCLSAAARYRIQCIVPCTCDILSPLWRVFLDTSDTCGAEVFVSCGSQSHPLAVVDFLDLASTTLSQYRPHTHSRRTEACCASTARKRKEFVGLSVHNVGSSP